MTVQYLPHASAAVQPPAQSGGEIITIGPEVNGTAALSRYDTAILREPADVLKEAIKAANVLADVIKSKPKKVMMNGEQYIEFEDWQTVGRFYGATAMCEGDPEFVQFGDVHGFKSTAVAINAEGRIISRATAYCLSDEEKWGERPKYEWLMVCKDGELRTEAESDRNLWVWEPIPGTEKSRPKKERRQVGMERVPLFQMASMSQTRACAKVLRNVFSFVPVLAGFRPTPAEELNVEYVPNDGSGQEQGQAPVTVPNGSEPATKAPAPQLTPEEERAAEWHDLIHTEGWKPDVNNTADVKAFLSDLYGKTVKSLTGLKAEHFRAARLELVARNEGRRRWFKLLSKHQAALTDEEQRTIIGRLLETEVPSRGKLTGAQWNVACDKVEADPDVLVVSSEAGHAEPAPSAEPAAERITDATDPFAATEQAAASRQDKTAKNAAAVAAYAPPSDTDQTDETDPFV